FYHIVVADSRSPRDGRFIERIGHFNPLLPKEKTARLKLDFDKVKEWMKKGAQPSDRVTRFVDAAGIMKREKRNNPQKAVPRKERKAAADEGRFRAGRQGLGPRKPPKIRKPPTQPPRARPKSKKRPTKLPLRRAPKRRRRASIPGTMAERVIVARIGAAHGVRGEVKLWPFTQDPMAVTQYGPLETEDGRRHFEVETVRAAKDHLVARLKGITDRGSA